MRNDAQCVPDAMPREAQQWLQVSKTAKVTIMKSLSLRLPETLDAKLTVAAQRRGETKSALVRRAIERFVLGIDVSCHDLAKGSCGCFRGPGDLSYSKKHIEGYGRRDWDVSVQGAYVAQCNCPPFTVPSVMKDAAVRASASR